MEVRAVMDLKTLPRIFEIDGVTMITGDPNGIINCGYEDCLVVKGNKVKKTKSIYYTLWDPLVTVSFRNATLKSKKDVRKLLEIVFDLVPADVDRLLIKYNYFSFKVYDKFLRGKILEFPTIAEVNGIKIYKAVEPRDIYILSPENGELKKRLDEDQFHKTSYIWLHGNNIEFSSYVFEYLYLSSFGGSAELLYIPESLKMKISNAENEQEITLEPGWVLLSAKSE